jgi:threonine dehydrogenase-like Zn-dependent dehydrogenase
MTATAARAATMAAAVVERPGLAVKARIPVPVPGPGEVLVRIEGCGVCASSLPLWEGRPWFTYPLEPGAPGHEGWGTVEVTGERVAFLSDRAFAEYAAVPGRHCVAIPPGPFPGEAVACAVNVVRRAEVRRGHRVAIVGMGFLGSLVAQLVEALEAEAVPVRRDGAVDGEFPRVIECVGTQEALDRASALVAERGRLVVAGYHQDGPRSVDLRSWNWRGIDVVNAHERHPLAYVEAMREAVELGLDVAPLLTHPFSLEELGAAFEAARRRGPGFVKAWVVP